MIISKIFQEGLGIGVNTLNEKNVETLGLAVSKPGKPFATFLENASYIKDLSEEVATVVTKIEVVDELLKAQPDIGICIVEKPRVSFFKLHNYLMSKDYYRVAFHNNKIAESSKIAKFVNIADHNVVIGENVVIEDFVTIAPNTVIGNNSIIRSGAVIGGEGFEFKADYATLFGVIHGGGVHIGPYVEIQNNTCVDKAIYPWDRTVIEEYTKVDNLVHIAHGVKIGKRVMIVAQAGIGGRVEIGDDSWIGLGATIRNGIKLGSHSRANMGSVVTKDVHDGESVSGNFAIDHKKFINRIKSID